MYFIFHTHIEVLVLLYGWPASSCRHRLRLQLLPPALLTSLSSPVLSYFFVLFKLHPTYSVRLISLSLGHLCSSFPLVAAHARAAVRARALLAVGARALDRVRRRRAKGTRRFCFIDSGFAIRRLIIFIIYSISNSTLL